MLMTGYTKLFGSIVASTIWREDDKTRIVWITMLAIANKHGEVEASVPGLADLARVSVSECRAALEKLSAPDPDSRSMEYEGRRIEKVEGGWRLINHAKYREKLSTDERREYLAQKQREHRARQQMSTSVKSPKQESTPSTHTEAEAETKAEAEANPLPSAFASDVETQCNVTCNASNASNATQKTETTPSPTAPKGAGNEQLLCDFDAFWKEYPRKRAKDDAVKAWKKHRPDIQAVLNKIREFKRSHEWTREGGRFIPYPASWLNSMGWEDELRIDLSVTRNDQQPAKPKDTRTQEQRWWDYWQAAYPALNAIGKAPMDISEWMRAGEPEN